MKIFKTLLAVAVVAMATSVSSADPKCAHKENMERTAKTNPPETYKTAQVPAATAEQMSKLYRGTH